jgi:GDSL-like lipase/acylhydrolase family protein
VTADPPRAPRRSRAAEWTLAAVSALFVLLVAGAAEIALRAMRPSFLRGSRVTHPHVYSEAYGWALRPGARYIGRNGETITVNARGYRGALHAEVAPAGVTRVVMLGDSITFGTGVADGQTFSDRLDALPGLEVVNLGVDGYGTDQELLRLEREGLSYHPRVVILNFCVRNDYFDNALPVALYDGRSPKPYFTLDGGALTRHDAHLRLSRRQRLAGALMEHSFLVNALLRLGGAPADESVGAGRDEADWGERRQMVLSDFERAAELTRRLILAAAARSAAAGASFVVLVHPDRRAASGDDTLVTPLTSGGLGATRVVQMRREYEARKLRFEDLTIDRLGHLGPYGHAAASEIIHGVIGSLPGGNSRS